MVSITIHFEFAPACALAHLPWMVQEQRLGLTDRDIPSGSFKLSDPP